MRLEISFNKLPLLRSTGITPVSMMPSASHSNTSHVHPASSAQSAPTTTSQLSVPGRKTVMNHVVSSHVQIGNRGPYVSPAPSNHGQVHHGLLPSAASQQYKLAVGTPMTVQQAQQYIQNANAPMTIQQTQQYQHHVATSMIMQQTQQYKQNVPPLTLQQSQQCQQHLAVPISIQQAQQYRQQQQLAIHEGQAQLMQQQQQLLSGSMVSRGLGPALSGSISHSTLTNVANTNHPSSTSRSTPHYQQQSQLPQLPHQSSMLSQARSSSMSAALQQASSALASAPYPPAISATISKQTNLPTPMTTLTSVVTTLGTLPAAVNGASATSNPTSAPMIMSDRNHKPATADHISAATFSKSLIEPILPATSQHLAPTMVAIGKQENPPVIELSAEPSQAQTDMLK